MISNEVLAERIEGYTKQTIAESQQLRRDISTVVEQMGRITDQIVNTADRIGLHEQQPGHSISLLRITALEKETEVFRKEVEALKKIVDIERDVGALKYEVGLLKTEAEGQKQFHRGRQSALSAGEKSILFLLACVGPVILLMERI